MKFSFLLIILSMAASSVCGQNNNRKPRIEGQDELATDEDEPITILMSHLDVKDADDWFYPWGFTMTIHPGDNYSFEGHVVKPAENFAGKLEVKVTVNDGHDDSNVFNLEITVNPVNDKPVITGHSALATNEGAAITILLDHLKVTDPDNKYPEDFSLRVLGGTNYTVSGHQVTPDAGFKGALAVGVIVNDGDIDSDTYSLPVAVNELNRIPQITGQATLQVQEDQALTIALTHLTVVDDDSNYPNGFTLHISAGEHYTFSNTTIRPASDYFGTLRVPVTVNDGANTSRPFDVLITVAPVNDVPVLTGLELEPISYGSAEAPVPLTRSLSILEVDGDSIMFAEVGFLPETYQINADKLVYSAPANSRIRGVFDVNTGILTLIGQASPQSYTNAIRSVTYQPSTFTSQAAKTIYFTANDGKASSEKVFRDMNAGLASVSLDIPTGFTPNGDLSNDTWKIIPLKSEEAYAQARIRVYNKAGIMVYESIGFLNEWDGRLDGELLPADTYFYTIDLNIDGPEGNLKGLVTILR